MAMAKQVESIRLDPSQKELLRIRSAELGMGMGEYIGLLLERDNLGRYRKPSADMWTRWQENRAAITLSDTQIALLLAIKKEYEKESNEQAPKNLKEFCYKHGFDIKIAKADLENLVKKKILNRGDEKDGASYVWTVEGIIILPEYAFKVQKRSCPILTGDILYLLKNMFGSYEETVRYIQDSLKISRKKARDTFKIILGEHSLFIRWLRDYAFDMTGIPDPDDYVYYRKQMMNFLMSYCLMIRDPDFIDADNEFRKLCTDLIKKLANYLKNQEPLYNKAQV